MLLAVVGCFSIRVEGVRAQEGTPEPEPENPPATMLMETHSIGIDPVVGRFVTRKLRAAIVARGDELIDTHESREAMNVHSIAYPPVVGDLWRLTYAVNADRGVLAVVWAEGGLYIVKIQVASRDGRGPFQAQGEAGQADLATAGSPSDNSLF